MSINYYTHILRVGNSSYTIGIVEAHENPLDWKNIWEHLHSPIYLKLIVQKIVKANICIRIIRRINSPTTIQNNMVWSLVKQEIWVWVNWCRTQQAIGKNVTTFVMDGRLVCRPSRTHSPRWISWMCPIGIWKEKRPPILGTTSNWWGHDEISHVSLVDSIGGCCKKEPAPWSSVGIVKGRIFGHVNHPQALESNFRCIQKMSGWPPPMATRQHYSPCFEALKFKNKICLGIQQEIEI